MSPIMELAECIYLIQGLLLLRNLVSGHESHVQLVLDWSSTELSLIPILGWYVNRGVGMQLLKQVTGS